MTSELQQANKLFRDKNYSEAAKYYKRIEKNGTLPDICFKNNLENCLQQIQPNNSRVEKHQENITDSSKMQETNIRCDINNFSDGILKGWAINDQSIDHPVKLHVFVNSQFDGSALCNLYRNDLENNKVGDGKGCYAFEYNIQTNYQDQEVIEIECKTDKDTSIKYGRSAISIDRHNILTSNLASYCDDIRRIYKENIFKDYRILASILQKESGYIKESAKVSIIMPTYNRKSIILKAIKSVQSQLYKNWELIICDDGSTDGTYQHVKQFTDDKRIKYLKLDHHGVSQARNAGLKASSGNYIAFLDSDNTWNHQYLNIMLSYICAGNLDAAYCQIAIKGQNKKIKGYRGDIFSWQSCLKRNYIDMNCFVHKVNEGTSGNKEIFDKSLKRLVDWDYILRITKDIKVSFCPLPLVDYYDGDEFERITRNVYTEGNAIQKFIRSIQAKHCDDIHSENLDKLSFVKLTSHLQAKIFDSEKKEDNLYFFPDYTSTNSYQDLFYEPLKEKANIKACSINNLISKEIENIGAISSHNGLKIFHLHWHNAFFSNTETSSSMSCKIRSATKKIELLKKLGFKIIWTLHNIKSHESRFESHEINFIKDIIGLSDHIIVHDLTTVKLVSPWYNLPLEKIIVCPHAGYQSIVNSKQQTDAKETLKEKYSIPSNSIIFASIGQIRTYKNLNNLAEVFSRISKKYKNIFLLIAGKPVHCDTRFLEETSKNNPNIFLELGFLSDEKLFSYLQDIDCLILNYSNVLTSGSYHLAETVGCPVICPDQGLLSNHIQACDAVFGFKNGDTELKNTISDFIESFRHQGSTLSKLILAKSSEVSWNLSANSFWLNLHLASKFKNSIIKYSSISHSWFLNESYQHHVKSSDIIAIVIHYSNTSDTLELIKSLENQTNSVDILIACNSDSQQDFELLTSLLPHISIIQKHVNGGYAAGVNLGLHIAAKHQYDYFWILNPDLEMEINTAEQFKTALILNDKINIAGCTLTGYGELESKKVKFCGGEIKREYENIGSSHMFDGLSIDEIPSSPFTCDYLTGANIFGRVSVLDELGFFPEELFLYFEETIWMERYIKKTGDKPWILPNISIKNKKRSERSSLPTQYYFFYMTRNWLIFAAEVNSSFDYSQALPESLKYFLSAWLKRIKSCHPQLLEEYMNIATCAYEHGLIKHTGINADISNFSRIWTDKFGISPLIKELI